MSFLGSERCKFEKWPADNAQKMTVQMLDECDLSDLEDVLSEFSVEINKHKIFYANNV